MGIQPEGQRKNDMGRPVFLGTDPILYFPGSAFIHRDVIQKSRGVSSPDFYQSQVLHTKVYRGLRGVTSSSGRGPADNLRPSPCDSGQSTRTLISPG